MRHDTLKYKQMYSVRAERLKWPVKPDLQRREKSTQRNVA